MQPHESPSPFYIWKFTAKLKNIGLKTKKTVPYQFQTTTAALQQTFLQVTCKYRKFNN